MNRDPLIVDARDRELALTPDRSFIVQAPAGSGKTELLTNRYLALLAHVDQPEEVVAITFTRKAASEMRNRVQAALEQAAGGSAPAEAHRRLTHALAQRVLARAGAQAWDLLANPGRLRISTIDSLCAALTRQMPLLSRLGAPPAVTEEAEALYQAAARELIALLESDGPWTPAIERLLRHLDNYLPNVEKLIAQMLARRDQWLRHVADRNDPRLKRETLEAALRHVIEDALQQTRRAVPAALVPELLALARYGADNLAADDPASAMLACRDLDALPGETVDDLAAWRGLAALLTTSGNGGNWRRKINATLGFPPASAKVAPAEKTRRQEAKDRFTALLAELEQYPRLRAHLVALAELPPPQYTDDQWQVVESLCVLLPLAVAQLRVVFQNRGEVDFTEIAWSAIQALGGYDSPSELALALDYRIRHLLVDEFQDTSLSQYELLERLTAGWTPDDGRTLFVVGDPMQSIYRFRQAEVGLYLRARTHGIGPFKLEPLQLKVNFRSQAGLVEWVNATFAGVFPRDEDIAAGAVTYAGSVAHDPRLPGAAVTVHPVFDDDRAGEAEKVLALVGDALSDAMQKTIAILVRSRGHLLEIAPRLKAAGLRFRAVEIEHLGHRPVVQDLLALTRALVHPGDRVAWLALLRAPWCGLTLADIEILAGGGDEASVWELMQDGSRRARLSGDGGARLARVQRVMHASLADRRRGSLRRLVEGAWLALGGPACVHDQTDLADAQVYLDALAVLEEGADMADLAALEERVAALYALPDVEADERLRIMTVHKAKGLEFHTVIVPGLGGSPPPEEPRLLSWHERPNPRTDTADLLLAPIRAAGVEQDVIYDFLRRFDRDKGDHEAGRLLYVAATRAIDRLHLLGQVATKDNNGIVTLASPHPKSLLAKLWPALAREFAAALTAQRAATPARVAIEPPLPGASPIRRLSAGWQLPAPPAAVAWNARAPAETRAAWPSVEFEWANETIRHVGTVVHRLLQRLGREGLARWEAMPASTLAPVVARLLAELGVPSAQIQDATARVEQALARTLADARGRWIFDPRHTDAHAEYPLTGIIAGAPVRVVLDRSFVDAQGVRWIVDYKTSAHAGGGREEFLDRERERYRAQLERYATLLAGLENRPIRLGLYFPLLGGWREWEPGQS